MKINRRGLHRYKGTFLVAHSDEHLHPQWSDKSLSQQAIGHVHINNKVTTHIYDVVIPAQEFMEMLAAMPLKLIDQDVVTKDVKTKLLRVCANIVLVCAS